LPEKSIYPDFYQLHIFIFKIEAELTVSIKGENYVKLNLHNGLLSISLGALMSIGMVLKVESVVFLETETVSTYSLVSVFKQYSSDHSHVSQSIKQSNSSRSEG